MNESITIYYKVDFSSCFTGIAVDGVFDSKTFETFRNVEYFQLNGCPPQKLTFDNLEVTCKSIEIGSKVETNIKGTLFIKAEHEKICLNKYTIVDQSHNFLRFIFMSALRKSFILSSSNDESKLYIQEEKISFENPVLLSSPPGVEVVVKPDGTAEAVLKLKNKVSNITDVSKYTKKLMASHNDSIDSSLFWLDAANFTTDETENNFVKKFMYVWMAFNGLYVNGSYGETKQIRDYILKNPELKKYLNNLFYNNIEQIKKFVDIDVKLKNKDVSRHLDNYIQGKIPPKNSECLEVTLILCIYAVRCNIFHGECDEKYLSLLRLCIKLLEPIVKQGIILQLEQ